MSRMRLPFSAGLVYSTLSALLLPFPTGAQTPAPEWTYLTEAPGYAQVLAIGPGGDIFAAGTSYSDFLVTRLPPAGPPPSWMTVADVKPVDRLSGFVVDAVGTSYLAGSVQHPDHHDFFVMQVLSDGVPGWTYSLHGDRFNDGARGLALDQARGALYVAGRVNGASLLAQLDAQTGELQWGYAHPEAVPYGFSDVAVDPAGDAYVAGGLVIKVDAQGAEEWVYRRPQTHFYLVILDGAGNVYAAGSENCGQYCLLSQVVKLSPLGVEQWVRSSYGWYPYDFVFDETGDAYAVGTGSDASEGPTAVMVKFAAANGLTQWARGRDEADFWAIALRGNSVLAVGTAYAEQPEGLFLMQCNKETGAVGWIYGRPSSTGLDVAVGAGGAIYVCGADEVGRFLVEKLTDVTGIEGVRAALAETVADGILVSWETEPLSRFSGFHLERRETSEGEFDRIEWVVGEGRRFAYLDHAVEPGSLYYYRIVAVRADGSEIPDPDVLVARAPEVARITVAIAPNPVRTGAEVRFAVPSAGGRLRLDILDVGGRLVRTLAEADFPGGIHREPWDARAAGIPPGTYFLRLHGQHISAVSKIVLLDRP